mgnify:CR=1 FL=1
MHNLREIRQRKGITQVKLSTVLEISQETVSAYENCKSLPSAETLCRMADFFGVSTDFLLDRTRVPYPLTHGLEAEEAELISYYRKLNLRQRAKAIGILEGMAEMEQKR